MNFPLLLLIANLALTSAVCLVFAPNLKVQKLASLLGCTLHLVLSSLLFAKVWNSGVQVVQIGQWPAPFGITLVCDLASALLVLSTALVYLAIHFYSANKITTSRSAPPFFIANNLFLLGATGAFLSGDLFNLYIWIELLFAATFVLLTSERTKEELSAAVPFVVLNVIGSFAFLVGTALLYGHTGNLNLAYLAQLLRASEWTYGIRTAAVFLFFACGLKASLFPLHFWLPRTYAAPPLPTGALISCGSTVVGLYSLLRLFTLVFPIARDPVLSSSLYVTALATMVIGALGAATEPTFKRVLAALIISQMGWAAWGLSLFSTDALATSLFILVHAQIVNSCFFIAVDRSQRFALLIATLSLAGFPGLGGFFAKFLLTSEAVRLTDLTGVACALVVSLAVIFSLLRLWQNDFFQFAGREFKIIRAHGCQARCVSCRSSFIHGFLF